MHILLYIQGVTPTTQASIEAVIKQHSWWHHLDNLWLICVPQAHGNEGQFFQSWHTWLTTLVQRDGGRFLLIEMVEGHRVNGLLPTESWAWIREHLKNCSG